MNKKEASKISCLRPNPKVIISVRNNSGNDNAMTVGYCMNCSFDPPMIAIAVSPDRHSHHMIKESGCFVVNLITVENQEICEYLGKTSGRNEDKFAIMQIQRENGFKVNAPIIKDCPINIECRVVDSVMTGSHELFIAMVEYVHAREDLVDQEGNIDYGKLQFL